MSTRMGENDKKWFRSERCLCINGEWFFVTREGSQEGPFSSEDEAKSNLCLYIRHHEGGWNAISEEIAENMEAEDELFNC